MNSFRGICNLAMLEDNLPITIIYIALSFDVVYIVVN